MRATRSSHSIILDVITLMRSGEEYNFEAFGCAIFCNLSAHPSWFLNSAICVFLFVCERQTSFLTGEFIIFGCFLIFGFKRAETKTKFRVLDVNKHCSYSFHQ
jgi:hypothetical protein